MSYKEERFPALHRLSRGLDRKGVGQALENLRRDLDAKIPDHPHLHHKRYFKAKAVGTKSLAKKAAFQTNKASKEHANYQDPSPKKNQKCGNCEHYDAGSCELVEGGISPQAWCKYWEKAQVK